MLIVDHQVGLMGAVRDYSAQDMYNNILLHANFGKLYNLPVVITTSTDQGNFLLAISLVVPNNSFPCAV